MKKNLVYVASVIISTLLFILILSFAGVLGSAALAAATMVTKLIGWLTLYFIMIRIPIALFEARERRAIEKARNAIAADSEESIAAAIALVKKHNMKLRVPTIDNPVTPMPADPDAE